MSREKLHRSVQESGLDAYQIDLIRNFSAGVEHADDLSNLEISEIIRENGAFGLSKDPYNGVVRMYGLIHYMEIPIDLEMQMNPRKKDGKYMDLKMENITKSRRVPLLFFVPSQVFTHPKARVTKEELEWFLNNPEHLGSVKFVFGLYDKESLNSGK